MLIPSVIAVVSYSTSDGRKISAKAASTLRVSDINGKEFSFEKTGDEEKDKIITIFRDMLDNSEKVSALPDALSGVPFYKVVFTADKIDTVYQFWFSKDDTDTYYTMSDGTTYRVNKSFVEPFLSTDIAQSLYVNSVVPVMTLSGEYSVPPVSAGSEASSWMYRNQSGLFVSAVMSDGEKQSSYDVEGGLAMSFDREPDKFTVTVVGADGTELFSDLYTNIASANIPEGASVSAGFGHMFNLTNKSVSFRHEGVDYKCVEGTAISACNAGKVVFAGEFDYTGRIVVIDHGYGLKTWYCHLSSSTVNVGDEVKRGDKIGTAGSTGFTNQSGVHVSMTVFDRTVLPYSTWEDNTDFTNAGIALGIPMYEKK